MSIFSVPLIVGTARVLLIVLGLEFEKAPLMVLSSNYRPPVNKNKARMKNMKTTEMKSKSISTGLLTP